MIANSDDHDEQDVARCLVAVKTDEYFGNGAEAHLEILVNAEIAKALRTADVMGQP